MLTLPEWKRIRRVDHFHIPFFSFIKPGGFNPRFRALSRRQLPMNQRLKLFDNIVGLLEHVRGGFNTMHLLCTLFTDILTYQSVTPDVKARYLDPVHQLALAIRTDISQTQGIGAQYQQAILQDISTHHAGGAWGVAKTVDLMVHYMSTGPVAAGMQAVINAEINAHIANANAIYTNAGININRTAANLIVVTQHGGQNLLYGGGPFVGNPVFPLNDVQPQVAALIDYCNAIPVAANPSIKVFYVDRFDDNETCGKSWRANVNYAGRTPTTPIFAITRNPPAAAGATHPTTLAHELGHCLTTCGDHSDDNDNLMAAGANRSGVNNLTDSQHAWFRNNPFSY